MHNRDKKEIDAILDRAAKELAEIFVTQIDHAKKTRTPIRTKGRRGVENNTER